MRFKTCFSNFLGRHLGQPGLRILKWLVIVQLVYDPWRQLRTARSDIYLYCINSSRFYVEYLYKFRL